MAPSLSTWSTSSMSTRTGLRARGGLASEAGLGWSLGMVDKVLHKEGRSFAHGVCPGVGIGGHATIVRCFFLLGGSRPQDSSLV